MGFGLESHLGRAVWVLAVGRYLPAGSQPVLLLMGTSLRLKSASWADLLQNRSSAGVCAWDRERPSMASLPGSSWAQLLGGISKSSNI